MTNNLSELKVGDPIAMWIGCDCGYYIKTAVVIITSKHISVKGSDLKFRKATGLSVGRSPSYIKVVTPAIQEEWDKKECRIQIDDILLKYKNLPSKAVKLLTEARDIMK